MNNGSNLTWADAREYCRNDTLLPSNNITSGTTHLVALEMMMEKTALLYWMNGRKSFLREVTFYSCSLLAYDIQSQFWIDGTLPSSSWNWSGQAISWYFTPGERAVAGNGTSLKLRYNSLNRTYQISDDNGSKPMNYICEYQGKIDSSMPASERTRSVLSD